MIRPKPYEVAAGALRDRVTFLAPTPAPDEFNEQVDSWGPVFGCWAQVEPLEGRELYRAQQVQPDATYRVTVRYRPGVNPDWRVQVRGGPVLNVLRVLDSDTRKRKLVLLCVERLEAGSGD